MILGAHDYLFSNLVIPDTQQIIGFGIHHSRLICKRGSPGTMVTDAGGIHGAAHIDIRGVAFYGNNCAYSAGFVLGANSIPFGTEGVLDQVWVRDLPTGFPGIDIRGNVGEFGFLISQATGGLDSFGTALTATQLECVGCSGFDVNGALAVCNFGDSQIGALEVEAPADGAAAVYLTGNTSIGMLTVSLQDGFTADHLVEVGPSAADSGDSELQAVFQAHARGHCGRQLQDRRDLLRRQCERKQSLGRRQLLLRLDDPPRSNSVSSCEQVNAFTLRLQNQGGVLEHLIGAVGAPTTPTKVAACVHNASSNPTPTPMGAQDFASGVKVSNLDSSSLILDTGRTGSWEIGDSTFIATIAYNNTGKIYTIIAFVAAEAVAGTNRNRLELSLRDAATGVPVNWSAALAGGAHMVDIMVLGFLK